MRLTQLLAGNSALEAGALHHQSQQHVQAITVAIDQYAEKALGNRDYFLNKPYGVG